MKKAKRIAISILAVLVIAFVSTAYVLSRPYEKIKALDSRYAMVAKGMNRDEVVGIMGGGDEWNESQSRAWWDDQPLEDAESDRVRWAMRYSVPTFFVGVTFEFTFDDEYRVVGRHRYD